MKSNHWWPRQHFPPAVVGALLDFKEQLDRTGARVGGCASRLSFQCRRPNVVSQEAVMYTSLHILIYVKLCISTTGYPSLQKLLQEIRNIT